MTEIAQQNTVSPVIETRQDGVATLMLNRPERLNAIDAALGRALIDALNRVAQDPSVRAVVLTGAGRGFCTGGDLGLLRDIREREAVEEFEALLRVGKQITLAVAGMAKPVIAAVNGPAAGAGCSLALACGVRLASDRALFAQSFAKIGLFPDFGGTYFLPLIVGPSRASEMFYTGDAVGAQEAVRIGLISRVVPHDSLVGETLALASRIAAAPPIVVRGIKQVLSLDHRETLEHSLDEEIRWQIRCFRSKDSLEGLVAYFEKRAPHFQGD